MEFWAHQLGKIREKLKTTTPEDRYVVEEASAKRCIDEVDAPVRAPEKRVKFETTEVNMTMTVKRTVEYESDEQIVCVKEERVSW